MMNAGGNGAMYNNMADYGANQGNMMVNPQFGGNFPPGFMAVGLNQAGGASSDFNRTIYLGNVGNGVTATEILNHVKTGAIESIRMLPDKGCVFLCFADSMGAQGFYQEYNTGQQLNLQGQSIKVGWGKPSSSSAHVQQAIQSGASRNVYIGNLDTNDNDEITTDEAYLRTELGRFGDIDQVKIIADKKIAFVHFYTVHSAMKCVSTLSSDSNWAHRRVNYGKDRCLPNYRQLQNVAGQVGGMGGNGGGSMSGANGANSNGGGAGGPFLFGDGEGHFHFGFDPYTGNPLMAPFGMAGAGANIGAFTGPLQRTLYLGNIPPETGCEDICNSVRGGLVYQIRFMEEKRTAFVTFVDPAAAATVFNFGQSAGLVVKGKRLRVGWGKPTAIPAATLTAIQHGATRNIYLGGTENKFTVEQLRNDFIEFGDLELISILPEKNCAFINFNNVTSAMKAIKGIRSNPSYVDIKVNYGKDRCDGPLRRRNFNHNHNNPSSSSQQPQQQSSPTDITSPTE